MLIALIILLILFAVATGLVKAGKTNQIDLAVSELVISKRNDTMTQIMLFFTNMGKGLPTLIICLALIFLPVTSSVIAKVSGLGAISTIIFAHTLKKVFKRVRPEGNRLVEEKDFSYPSAHAFASAALYGGILLNAALFSSPLSWIVRIICVLMIFFIGFSRVYLGIHYIMDIIGGWSIGLAVSITLTILLT